jgi:hypothetical protein
VLSAQVDLATKEVHVRYRRGEVTLEAMREATDRVDLRLRARHWFHRWLTRIRRSGP